MEDLSLSSDRWYLALTLEERARGVRPVKGTREPGETGRLRLDCWKRQSPFDQEDWLARRLALDGLDEEQLARLLDESPEEVRARASGPPGWLIELQRAFAAPPPSAGPAIVPGALEGAASRAFLEMIRPLTDRARERLEEHAREIAGGRAAPFDPAEVTLLLWPAMEGPLVTMLSRTLVLELHVARVEGRLEGAAPEERFQSFARALRDPRFALAILQEYPVLARQIVTFLDRWVESSRELLEHLCAEAPALRETFSPERDPGRLTALDGGAGDPHRGGRSVLIATFASGLRLVYKPRPLAVDVHFQELLVWVDQRSGLPPFRPLRLLDRGDHGWVEFVEAEPCVSEAEVWRFHLRLGGLLALFYALEATDVHFENLIASGEHPVPIDLECLFHPRIRPVTAQPDLRIVNQVLPSSVVGVGLLPFRIEAGEDYEGFDISGLAAVEGEMSPQRVLQWEKPATDEMVAVRRRVPLSGGSNRPRLGDREVDTLDYAESLVEGFTTMYRALTRHRNELSDLLDLFASDPVRTVLRATRGYHLLWFESFHPDMLRDALDRDLFLDHLWVDMDEHPHLVRPLPFERRDLLDGDIPAFGSRPGSVDLWAPRGERLPGYFEEPSLAAVRRKLENLGEEDLRFQTWLVRTSVATLAFRREVIPWPRFDPVEPPGEVSLEDLRERLLASARAAGDRLEELALRGDGEATWIGVELHQQRWSLVPLAEDLYAGTPGVLLFLAWLGELTGEGRYTDLARNAMHTLRGRLRHTAPAVAFTGAFQGWGGIVYTFTRLADVWGDRSLLEEVEPLLEHLPPLIETDRELDIVGGAAGCIAGLLGFWRETGSPRALALATLCGEHLLARAEPAGEGLGWKTRITANAPLTGFSHGTAGIGWALWRLAEATGDDRFRKAARGAFLYEHGRYDAERNNWLDVGDQETAGRPRLDGERATCTAWCYGAPGVGLSRLPAVDDDPRFRQDIAAALRALVERGFGFNHSLCHGDLGNLDILLQMERSLDRSGLRREIARRTWSVLDSMDRHGFLCGTPLGIELPGLMNGLAGIGYGLLRLAEPERVPSVLGLEGVTREGDPG